MEQYEKEKSNKDIASSRVYIVFWIVVVAAVLITVLFVCANVFFIIPNNNSQGIYVTEALTATLSIIGLAVAVWTGLNIVNAIERKDYEALKERTETTHNELQNSKQELYKQIELSKQEMTKQSEAYETREKKQQILRNNAEKIELLDELSKTGDDAATRRLMGIIKNYTPEDNVSVLSLVEVERNFRLVYKRHTSEYRTDLKLEAYANDGIRIAEEVLKHTNCNELETYLQYRIAEFNYYKGYCVLGIDRFNFFQIAIDGYFKTANNLNGNLPVFKEDMIYPDIDYEGCNKNQMEISAYICNSIGDSYSKIVEIKGKLKEELKDKLPDSEISLYEKKAVFYCAYAYYWYPKSLYCRNLGVALERQYTKNKIVDPTRFDILFDVYKTALSIGVKTVKDFKTYLSIVDKYINQTLKIGFVSPSESRTPSLESKDFASIWLTLTSNDQNNIIEKIEILFNIAQQTKTLYPNEIEGYQYMCIYYRDMCAIFGNYRNESDSKKKATMKKKAKDYLTKAKNELDYFELLAPKSNMVKILRNDLSDLRKLI